jgi:hypothetical protein
MGYTIHVDGELLYSTEAEDISQIVLNPKLDLDINGAGSLHFVIPPSHAMHGTIKRLKSIVTVEQNGDELFRGRMVDSESDCFNQETVTCEGEKSFLLDSLYESGTFNGNARELFRRLIDNHNSQVEESKRFTAGTITAVDSSAVVDDEIRVETRKFHNTQTAIDERLMGVYGGYLRTRKNGNTRYIDWVKEYGGENSQEIKFAVNLLDLQNKISGEDVFTVLIPLGYSEMGSDGSYTDPVNITSVNGGTEYIQDDAAVALYGKIWRTRTWGQTKEPSKLLEKAREYLKTGIAFQSLTLNAVDMHIIDDDISKIKIGDKVHIVSDPNGVDLWMVCSKMTVDLVNPEKSEYTFGEKSRTLTEGIARTERDVDGMTGRGGRGGGGGRKSLEDELQDILRWAKITTDESNAQILLSAGEINKLIGRTSTAEIAIDGLNAAVITKASIETVDELTGRVTKAESSLIVQAGQITSLVKEGGVISYINQTPASIKISAKNIELDGHATISQLSSEIASIGNFFSGVSEASVLKATMVNCTGTLLYQNSAVSWKDKRFVTSVNITQEKNIVSVKDVNGNTVVINYVTGVSANPSTSSISYLGN